MNGYHSQRTEVACTSLYNVRIPFSPLLVIIVPFHVQSFLHFCEKLNVSRKHISQIEAAISRPSLETLVDIANILNISADDLLVDSLTHSASTADSEIHRLLLDCNAIEKEILTRIVKEMKAILYGLGV